ncbi:unnamed protein product [Rotaria magnacalcarata]
MNPPIDDRKEYSNNFLSTNSPIYERFSQHTPRCHRGFDLRVWLNNEKNLTRTTCFCPPSFYGDMCQYQNQRISLTIQFRVLSDSWSTLFAIIVSLIDHNIYEKVSLSYRGSLLYPIKFPFLPVHRLAYIGVIPQNDSNLLTCSDAKCIHGWSGKYCAIPYNCTCASDSICLGTSANNRSICVCSVYKFGSRCLLTDRICEVNNNLTCQNNGRCIPTNDDMISNDKFKCICPKGYSGERCQTIDNKEKQTEKQPNEKMITTT